LIELAGRGFDTKVVKALVKVMEHEKKRGFSKSQPLTQKVLVVKGEAAKSLLDDQGFETIWANNGQEALQLVFETFPNLVLLNKAITDISPLYFCRRIKSDPRTSELPIIILAKRKKAEEEVAFLNGGANDYLTMPPASESAGLIARIKCQMHRNRNGVSINPLTGLPESFFIEERIKMCLSNKREDFSILFIDLDNFKVFNSRFGFLKGDELLKIVARISTSAVEELGNESDLIGHRGGDDFIVITTPDKIDALCKQIILEFDARVKAFYSIEERKRGFITIDQKTKKAAVHPIITVSIGVVSNKEEEINSYYEIEEMAMKVVESAKEIHRSSYY
jgi:diguanylate cyclase (GGDEF)-like protein